MGKARLKHILVAILGRTPQIITETLFALSVTKNMPISELVILTTEEGKSEAEKKLLHPNSGKVYRLIKDYPKHFSNFKMERIELLKAKDLPDIRNVEDNELFIDMLMRFIRKKSYEPNTVLHCSLAGGRKTMSVYLTLALQFFGRPKDRLYHVLVSPPEFESNEDFYYPPPIPQMIRVKNGSQISTEEAYIQLAEVPFVRLRSKLEYLFGREPLSFAEMVNQAQRELEQFPDLPPLIVDVRKRTIFIGEKEIYLPQKEFAMYWFCTKRSKNRPDNIAIGAYHLYFEPVKNGEFYRDETLQQLKELYRKVRPGAYDFTPGDTQSIISKIRHKIETAIGDTHMSEYYIISSVGKYADKRYGIKLDKSKITII